MRKVSVPLSINLLNEESLGEYIRLLKHAQVERVFLCCWGGEYAENPEETAKRVTLCRKYKPVFEKEGIEVAAWISGFGHGGVLAHDTEREYKEYQKLMGPAGDTAGDSFCPLDEEFVKDYLAFVGEVASFHPSMIMFDDDLRLSVRSYGMGCFCPLHMQKLREKLDSDLSREELANLILSGMDSIYRDAFLTVMGETILDFAGKIRDKVNEIDPTIRLGAAMCYDVWDINGTDGIELAKVLAGENEPFLRTIGAPYWAALDSDSGDLISVAEYTRMQLAWCEGLGIECTTEGDVYPRPRYNVPARYLELFDLMIIASGGSDYILKYMFDYNRKVDYETGYVDRHIRNQTNREALAEIFAHKNSEGVYIYESMHKMRDYDFSQLSEKQADILLNSLFGRAQYLLAHNGISTYYGSDANRLGYAVAAFGENARTLPLEYLDRGVITDCVGARILTERGVDIGYKGSSYETFNGEYFPEADDTISFHSIVTCRMECDKNVKVLSTFEPGEAVASYLYENGNGQRFLVFGYDSYASPAYLKTADYIVNYHRQKQLKEAIQWLGGKILSAKTEKYPYLYTLTARSEDDKTLSVGLFNAFRDEVAECQITLDRTYAKIHFVNCRGKLQGNMVTLQGEIAPLGFAAFEVEE